MCCSTHRKRNAAAHIAINRATRDEVEKDNTRNMLNGMVNCLVGKNLLTTTMILLTLVPHLSNKHIRHFVSEQARFDNPEKTVYETMLALHSFEKLRSTQQK
jgi:hypothetical protein